MFKQKRLHLTSFGVVNPNSGIFFTYCNLEVYSLFDIEESPLKPHTKDLPTSIYIHPAFPKFEKWLLEKSIEQNKKSLFEWRPYCLKENIKQKYETILSLLSEKQVFIFIPLFTSSFWLMMLSPKHVEPYLRENEPPLSCNSLYSVIMDRESLIEYDQKKNLSQKIDILKSGYNVSLYAAWYKIKPSTKTINNIIINIRETIPSFNKIRFFRLILKNQNRELIELVNDDQLDSIGPHDVIYISLY